MLKLKRRDVRKFLQERPRTTAGWNSIDPLY
jgi:hypothetical protein